MPALKITQILLDLDGVLGDWVGAVARLYGHDPVKFVDAWPEGVGSIHDVLGIPLAGMWDSIDNVGAKFWANVKPYPWSQELYRLCCSIAPTTICTSPSIDPQSAAGKMMWMSSVLNNGRPFRKFSITGDKPGAAHPHALLIDDFAKNIEAFEAGNGMGLGGQGILFPRPWNNMRSASDRPMEYMRQVLGLVKANNEAHEKDGGRQGELGL